MQHRYLGATGMSVSDTALGAMNFGGFGNTAQAETARMIHRAIDAGINIIDTADVYGGGQSEEIVGEALQGHRDEVVLATKFGLPGPGGPNHQGASPRWIRRAIEASLHRLRTDHIDLYQLHRYDWNTGLDETLGALTDLQRAGLIRTFGHSSFPAEKIAEAQWAAEHRGSARFLTEQPSYSIVNRAVEVAVLPTAQRYHMGVLSYSALANGWLSGRDLGDNHRAMLNPPMFDTTNPANARRAEVVDALTQLAAQAGLPLPHLAHAFARAHPAITTVIIGPRTPQQLEDSIASSDIVLTDDILDAIDEIVPPGTDVNPADTATTSPRRRSPTADRADTTARRQLTEHSVRIRSIGQHGLPDGVLVEPSDGARSRDLRSSGTSLRRAVAHACILSGRASPPGVSGSRPKAVSTSSMTANWRSGGHWSGCSTVDKVMPFVVERRTSTMAGTRPAGKSCATCRASRLRMF
jgi:aryl-alcohol dehydrogenase-like predicted oxidoreductase